MEVDAACPVFTGVKRYHSGATKADCLNNGLVWYNKRHIATWAASCLLPPLLHGGFRKKRFEVCAVQT